QAFFDADIALGDGHGGLVFVLGESKRVHEVLRVVGESLASEFPVALAVALAVARPVALPPHGLQGDLNAFGQRLARARGETGVRVEGLLAKQSNIPPT
ncbi:MAG: hypothetical protein ABIN96_00915, partial [Rubrivivax sp.]